MNNKYWEKRTIKRMLEAEKSSYEYINRVIELYDNSLKSINKDIMSIFNRYAKDNFLSNEEAKKLLNTREKKEFYDNLLKEINTIKDKNIKKKLLAKYNSSSYAARISRLEAMKENLHICMCKLGDIEKNINYENYKNIIQSAYNTTIFDIQKDVGFAFNFDKININLVETLLSNKWSGNKNYSSRIWENINVLNSQLERILTTGLTTGKSINKMSIELQEQMNVGKFVATRLIRTETNYFVNQAEKIAYENSNVDEYIWISTLDVKTCKHCAELDLKSFKLSNAKVGINYPPLHPFDRCTTIPKVNLEMIKTRIARDKEGNNIKIPSTMSYNEWKEKYIDNSIKDDIITPDYIRMNISNGFNPKKEIEAINSAISEMPLKIQKDLKESTIEIFSKGQITKKGKEINTSFYDRNKDIIHIYEGANKSEVIHEIGHVIETKYNILNDYKYINIRDNGLKNYSIYAVIDLKNYSNIKGIKNNKFISEQQGRIYNKDLNGNSYIADNQKVNLNCLGEYFSEGFREYFDNPENLKLKDIELFKYIERKLN